MLQVTNANFEKDVLRISIPVIIDYYADWCGPCKMLAPVFEKVSKEFAGKMTFVKLNVDEAQELAQKYDVRGIPCMIIFKNGKEADRLVGNMNEGMLKDKVAGVLKSL